MVSYISNEPQKRITVMWCQVTHNQKPASSISKQEQGIRKQEDKKYEERKMMWNMAGIGWCISCRRI